MNSRNDSIIPKLLTLITTQALFDRLVAAMISRDYLYKGSHHSNCNKFQI